MKKSKFLLSVVIIIQGLSCGLFDSSDFSYGYFGQIPLCTPNSTALVSGISGSEIHINRISGEIPFHVYVSASNVEISGVNNPYDELTFSWNFGDAASVEAFTHPVTTAAQNTNTAQSGPEAAYVYRTAGTYTITLTITLPDGSTVQRNQNVTVGAWSGSTKYFDPTSGADTNSGDSLGAAWRSAAKMGEWLGGGDKRRALLKSGTTMAFDVPITLGTSYIRIANADAGAKPILRGNSTITTLITLSTRTSIVDHVYSGVVFNGNSGTAEGLIAATITTNFDNEDQAGSIEGLGLVDVDFINDDVPNPTTKKTTNLVSLVNQAGFIRDVTLWNTTFERGYSDKNGIYAEMREHFAVVGGYFNGGDGSILRDHHIYANHVDHSLYRWVDFKPAFGNNFAVNNNTDEGRNLQYQLVDGCNMRGTSNGLDFSGTGNLTSWYSNVIVQNSSIHDAATYGQGYGIIGETVKRITIRDNLFYMNPLEDINIQGLINECTGINLYRNKFWKGERFTDEAISSMFQFKTEQSISMTDNIFVHEGLPGGSRMIGGFESPNTSGWNIDRNTYYAPNLSTVFNTSVSGLITFADWQALGFDLNGSNTNPNFTDPRNGSF